MVTFAWSAAHQNRHDLAEQTYRRALDLNPCDPWTVLSCAHGLAGYGAFDEVVVIARRMGEAGVVTGPALWCLHAGTMVLGGDHEAGLASAQRIGADCLAGELWRVLALVGLEREADARTDATRLQKRVAERWVQPRTPTPGDIGRWLVSCTPAGIPLVRERITRHLLSAGIVLPDDLVPGREVDPWHAAP